MTVERLELGNLGANCYIVGDESQALVIDPGDQSDLIVRNLRQRELKYILLTHTHYDHIGAVSDLKRLYPNAKLAVHEKEASYLKNAAENLSQFLGKQFVYDKEPDILLTDGMELPFLGKMIKVIHTPGHTPGGCCFLLDNYLFTGDTLFAGSIGRTDFPGGSYEELIKGVKEKLFTLDENLRIFPGHMEESTIKKEKNYNPFFRVLDI